MSTSQLISCLQANENNNEIRARLKQPGDISQNQKPLVGDSHGKKLHLNSREDKEKP